MPDKSAPTLADLARLSGLSTSTVSRALADNPAIREETREKIKALAREHGYRPNIVGRSLRTGRTQAIGVVLPLGHEVGQPVSDPFFITLLGHLADALTARGYDLLLSRIIPSNADWLRDMTETGRVDGVLVIGQSDQVEAIEAMAKRYAPLVVWGALMDGLSQCVVGTDNRLGGRLATEHLLKSGRRRLVFFGNPDFPELGERYQGFLQAHAELGVAAPAHPLAVHLTPQTAYETIRSFLDETDAVDGVVAATDIIALSTIRALSERGLRVPDDVAVVGYDDLEIAIHASPALTTVRQDIGRGAQAMVDLLLRRLEGEPAPSLVMAPKLVVRASAP
ncbi:LacI family DNA-binding transcriptional regulator [Brevundimonas sp. SORGH_AS_0993]|uniref:LacI family DNA-binding transcriptional regulator n=1 Tax=Brevundimonas sp. SORGH_AS_0993 TaxID=3041794 RepID=UPI0027846EEE|nr:LacI family DNA-binding transcriptional regulator [Brevundimonas sp. SORGH_AS_0993]MDQ1155524.1 DNA-binding LacI/PurR family transcriptional regulator [Brevundimonas sp. SORGH_AS_0993]